MRKKSLQFRAVRKKGKATFSTSDNRLLIVKTNNPDLSRLPAIFSRYPDIEAVYLFGSWARKQQNDQSDIDLGVVTTSTGAEGNTEGAPDAW